LGLGRTLKETRIKRGISLSDVSRELLIQELYLEAIEDEIDGVIQSGTYQKIYTRAYCKFLGIEFRDDTRPPVLPKVNDVKSEKPRNVPKEKETEKAKAADRKESNPEPHDLEFSIDINKIFRISRKILLLLVVLYLIIFLIVTLIHMIFK